MRDTASPPSVDGSATQTASAKFQVSEERPPPRAAIRLRQPTDDGLLQFVSLAVAGLIP